MEEENNNYQPTVGSIHSIIVLDTTRGTLRNGKESAPMGKIMNKAGGKGLVTFIRNCPETVKVGDTVKVRIVKCLERCAFAEVVN